jgi:putative transposase
MARQARAAPGGLVYHVLNRSVGRITLFRTDRDFEAFERIILSAHERHPLRLLSYCVMPTHWHFVVWPREDHEVTEFFKWLAHTHAMRWRVAHQKVGYGPLYQGRFKSFPIQEDDHLLTVCRYVERNPVAAGIAKRSADWRWGSAWIRLNGDAKQRSVLSEWPVDMPANWVRTVDRPLRETELSDVKQSVERGRPLGDDRWIGRMVSRLNLRHTIRQEGRPRKTTRDKN